VWLLWLLGYNVSIAVWVGLIALMGLDAETGVFMLLFLDLSHGEARQRGQLRTRGDLVEAIIHGAVKRVRPKAMTVFAALIGLLPIMWSTGIGADLMKRIAAPMVGGLVTSFALELLVYPPCTTCGSAAPTSAAGGPPDEARKDEPMKLKLAALTLAALLLTAAIAQGSPKDLRFTDVKAQTQEFWATSRSATAEQEAIKKEALTAIPAPAAATTPVHLLLSCNFSRTVGSPP
jgi:hypothetical protein